MTRIGFPINVVVIHRADHVTIQKRRIDRISLEAGDKCGRRSLAVAPALATGRVRRGGHRAIMLQQNLGVVLLATTERAADGIEPE